MRASSREMGTQSMPSMFGSTALPLPSPFARERRPLQLTAEAPRPLPTGGCRYILPVLQSSSQNPQCACQSFHINRAAPASICECGHQACYHVHEPVSDKQPNPETLSSLLDKVNALSEKCKRMEETIQNERGSRESAFQRERQMWERDVRVLREALAPFYTREKEVQRRLTDMEDRLEGNYDEQIRLRDRVVVLDDTTMLIEKRVEELEGSRSKRRRINRPQGPDEPNLNGHTSPASSVLPISSSADERSVHTPSSRALSPNGAHHNPPDADEPRSSGILNLVELPRSTSFNVSQHISPAHDEPRSSGFLTLEVAKPLAPKPVMDRGREIIRRVALTPPQDRPSPPGYSQSDPEVSRPSYTPPEVEPVGKMPLIDVMVLPVNTSPRKRKHHLEHMALDVLADVSMASPLIH